MKILGVTGGIGAGKTTVGRIFACLNIPIYNSDERAKILMHTHPQLKKKIVDYFGKDSYLNDGQLNTKYLSTIIFNQKDKLKQINQLVHPVVIQDSDLWFETQKKNNNIPFVIKESALLIESKAYKKLDYLLNIQTSLPYRIERISKRDAWKTVEEKNKIEKIIQNQISDEHRNKYCHFIISNNPQDALIPQVVKVYQSILRKD